MRREKPIALWSVPRSISTAFERVFVERGDSEVLHEPFSAAYYHGEGRSSDRYADEEPNISGRSWSAGAAIDRVEYAVDGDTRWRAAELFGPNLPGAWARWRFAWNASAGRHELRVRATDTAGKTQPAEAPWNELGYLYGAVVAHPVEVI